MQNSCEKELKIIINFADLCEKREIVRSIDASEIKEELKMVDLVQGDYLKVKKHYEKKQKSGYFEFDFAYAGPLEIFREIDRFIWESRHSKTRYQNSYKGPVLVDLSGWNDKPLNDYFDAFMYYLKDNYDAKCTFFCREECSEELEKKLREFFKLSVVSIGLEDAASTKKAIGFSLDGKENIYVRS